MTRQTKQRTRLSRREFIKRGAGGAAMIAGGGILTAIPESVSAHPVQAASGSSVGDLVLVNGKFVDGRGVVAPTLTIKNGRIVKVGQALNLGPDARTIDL